MKSSTGWLIAWIVVSLAICIGLNLYTQSPMLDLTWGHLVIAGMFGFLVIAPCFVIVKLVLFVARVLG